MISCGFFFFFFLELHFRFLLSLYFTILVLGGLVCCWMLDCALCAVYVCVVLVR